MDGLASTTGPYAPPEIADAPAVSTSGSPVRRNFPGPLGFGLIFGSLIGAGLAQFSGAAFDQAVANLITQSLLATAVISAVVWFACFSNYSIAIPLGALLGLSLLAIVLFTAVLRVDEVSGEMWIRKVSFRWQPKRDAALGRLTPTAKQVLPATRAGSAGSAGAATPTLLSQPTSDDFPRYFGRDGTGYLPGPQLAADWSARPPKILWKRPLGAGWSAFATSGELAYTLEQRGPEEWVAAYHIPTGEPVWGHAEIARHESVLGGVGPRSTPTIDRGVVFASGATGVVRALDAETGMLLWRFDTLQHLGLTQAEDDAMIFWGRAPSPLCVGDLVVVGGGGKPEKRHTLLALDRTTGKVAWETGDLQIGYSSPVLLTLGGEPQIVFVSESHVTGHDPATGRELWRFVWFGNSTGPACTSQPQTPAENRLLISKAYGVGGKLLEVAQQSGKWSVRELPDWGGARVLKTKFTSPVIIGQHVYALSDGILECVSLETGRATWKKGRYQQGQILGVGASILVQAEDGSIAHVAADPQQYRELGRFEVLEGKTWNNLCLHGKRLLVRNGEEAACVELPLAE